VLVQSPLFASSALLSSFGFAGISSGETLILSRLFAFASPKNPPWRRRLSRCYWTILTCCIMCNIACCSVIAVRSWLRASDPSLFERLWAAALMSEFVAVTSLFAFNIAASAACLRRLRLETLKHISSVGRCCFRCRSCDCCRRLQLLRSCCPVKRFLMSLATDSLLLQHTVGC
jgi:hypothetical protein